MFCSLHRRVGFGLGIVLVVGVGVVGLVPPAQGFGIENLRSTSSSNHVHYTICKDAAKAAGFSETARKLVCWHDDAIDAFQNIPGVNTKFVHPQHLGRGHWEAAHFDNLFAPDRVVNQWQRYVYGALYGLLWAAERADVTSALAILGVAAHAIEDFFSHSTWANDDKRRAKSPFDYTARSLRKLPRDGRNRCSLWTGSYHRTAPAGMSPHGQSGKNLWEKVATVGGRGVDECLEDAGINLDRTCAAKHAVKNRKLTDVDKPTGPALFAAARKAAGTAGKELFRRLRSAVRAAGQGKFWSRLTGLTRKRPPLLFPALASAFHKDNAVSRHAPWGFITGGEYGAADGWHLRIQIVTRAADPNRVSVSVGGGAARTLQKYQVPGTSRPTFYVDYVGPVAQSLSKITISGVMPQWRVPRLTVWAYRIGGGQARFGRVVDLRDVDIGRSRTFPLSKLPRSSGSFSAFGRRRVPDAAADRCESGPEICQPRQSGPWTRRVGVCPRRPVRGLTCAVSCGKDRAEAEQNAKRLAREEKAEQERFCRAKGQGAAFIKPGRKQLHCAAPKTPNQVHVCRARFFWGCGPQSPRDKRRTGKGLVARMMEKARRLARKLRARVGKFKGYVYNKAYGSRRGSSKRGKRRGRRAPAANDKARPEAQAECEKYRAKYRRCMAEPYPENRRKWYNMSQEEYCRTKTNAYINCTLRYGLPYK